MAAPTFSSATVEVLPNGVRIRGKALEASKIGKSAFLLFFGFGCVVSLLIFLLQIQAEGYAPLKFQLEQSLFIMLFFTLMGAIPYLLLTHGLHILRVATGYHKLWWDDFTYDGLYVKSRRYKFKSSEIKYVEPGIRKFPDNDSWHYASVMNHSGVEIGRVMVTYHDKRKMVKYLSDLFGTP